MSYSHDLCILFLYHKCDALTKFHLKTLRDSNPQARIIPLTDTVPELLPDSVDVGLFPSSFENADKWRTMRISPSTGGLKIAHATPGATSINCCQC